MTIQTRETFRRTAASTVEAAHLEDLVGRIMIDLARKGRDEFAHAVKDSGHDQVTPMVSALIDDIATRSGIARHKFIGPVLNGLQSARSYAIADNMSIDAGLDLVRKVYLSGRTYMNAGCVRSSSPELMPRII